MQGPGLNFDLGESIDMLRDAVHTFAQSEIAPLAAKFRRRISLMKNRRSQSRIERVGESYSLAYFPPTP